MLWLNMNFIEIVGWIGSIIYIVAYFLLTYKIIEKGKIYYLLNKIAALLIIIISIKKNTFQPVVINGLWLYISYLGYNKINLKIEFLTKNMMHIISLIFTLVAIITYFIYERNLSFDILAWLSVFAFSSSYFLFSTKKIKERTFHFYNLIAAIAIIPKMYIFDNFQVVTLEVIWAFLALQAYIKISKNNDYLTVAS